MMTIISLIQAADHWLKTGPTLELGKLNSRPHRIYKNMKDNTGLLPA